MVPLISDWADSPFINFVGVSGVPYNVIIDHTNTVTYLQGGLNETALTNAIDAALNQIAAEYPGQRVVVITHNGTIKSAARVVVGAPAESIFHIDVSPCSITTVSIWPSDGLRALRSLNEQAHLQ